LPWDKASSCKKLPESVENKNIVEISSDVLIEDSPQPIWR
jgi:hypothetical protein